MSASTAAERSLLDWLASLIAGDALADVDFDKFAPLLVESRLEPLAGLHGGGERFADATRRAFAKGSFMERASADCIDLLHEAGIAAVTLKGPAFASRYWGDVAVRPSMDVDLLVAPADLPASRRAFEARGYRVGGSADPGWYESRWHYHRTLNREQPPSPTIELHWAVARPGLAHIDAAAIVAGRESVRCLHGELPAPAPGWALLVAALHAARHHFPLREVVDLAFVARTLDDAQWAAVVRDARRASIGPVLYYALSMVGRRFGGDLPPGVAGLRPRDPQDAIVRRYLDGLHVTGRVGKTTLRVGKVVTPLTSSSLSRLPAGLVWSLSDHPRLAARLDRAVRRGVDRGRRR
jgi:hypothetical protein